MNRHQTALLALGACLTIALPAAAHEYWLTPSAYRARSGEIVRISAWNGEGFAGEQKLYAADRTVSLDLHAARDLDLTRVARDGDSTFARFAAPDDSGIVVSFVSTFSSITLPAERFDAYLESDGLDAPRAARAKLGAAAGPGRERFRRCCKAWIAGVSSRRVMKEFGLPMEITPLGDPAKGCAVRVRVTFEGHPLAGVLVNVWNRPAGTAGHALTAAADASSRAPAQTASLNVSSPSTATAADPVFSGRTDPDGELDIPLNRNGEWLISGVHMVPSHAEDADWESTWASLTFERP